MYFIKTYRSIPSITKIRSVKLKQYFFEKLFLSMYAFTSTTIGELPFYILPLQKS